MTNLRDSVVKATFICAIVLGACTQAEPDLPTFDPLDKVMTGEGWKAGRSIVVSPGADSPQAHHVQAITSGLHNIDFKTPPASLTPVEPSCAVTNPGMGGGKYMILGDGWAQFPLLKKNIKIPKLMTFNNDVVNKLGQAKAYATKHGTSVSAATRKMKSPSSGMAMKDVFITETSESVVLALAGGGLYNFHIAPGARLAGVVVYSKTDQAAVAGVPNHVPVEFISKIHPATRGCWTRIQARPDKSWSKSMQRSLGGTSRYEALKPFWKTFHRRVRKDIGNVPEQNVISVNYAGHFLIGPAPTRYEDRLPYVAYAGKPIRYLAADHAQFGTADDNKKYARELIDQYYKAHLAAAK